MSDWSRKDEDDDEEEEEAQEEVCPVRPPWRQPRGKSYVDLSQMPPDSGGICMGVKETIHLPLGCLQGGAAPPTSVHRPPRCLWILRVGEGW